MADGSAPPVVQVAIPTTDAALYRHVDGSFWLQIIVTSGPIQTTFAIPMTHVDEWLTGVRNGVGRIKEEWKKARTGLVLPNG